MSNIYDSANALSRGLRELPEYKAVKEARIRKFYWSIIKKEYTIWLLLLVQMLQV